MQGFEVKAERGGGLVTRNSLGMSLLSLCPRQFVVVGEGFFLLLLRQQAGKSEYAEDGLNSSKLWFTCQVLDVCC